MSVDKHLAVLIFTRDIHEESREKQLLGKSVSKNLRVFKSLNNQIKETVVNSKLPFFIIDSTLQVGASFAARYKNAIQSIFQKGFERVIVVGNDSPELHAADLNNIDDELAQFDVVFGTTQKGGIYTLALSKKGFDELNFDSVPWNSNRVAGHFSRLQSENNFVYKLSTELLELNTVEDVIFFLNNKAGNQHLRSLYQLLYHLLFDHFKALLGKDIAVDLTATPLSNLRGPPQN